MKFSLIKKNQKLAEIEMNNEDEKLRIGEGSCFGDLGLLYDTPRSASVLAVANTTVISIDKDKFLATFGKSVNKATADKVNFLLRTVTGLKELGRVRFDDYYSKMPVIYYYMNERVFARGSSACFLYIIYEGRFELKGMFNGRERKVIELEKGDIGGFEIVNGEKDYSYSLTVKF